jgi:hypothetical protein
MSFFNQIAFGFVQQLGVSPFSPEDISGLQLWLAELVNDGTVRSTLSDGASITAWDDKSTSNNDASANSVPTYDETEDAIYLDGVSDYLQLDTIINHATGTTFLVIKAAGNTQYGQIFSNEGDNSKNAQTRTNNSTQLQSAGGGGNIGNPSISGINNQTQGILRVWSDGSKAHLGWNGTSGSSTNHTSTYFPLDCFGSRRNNTFDDFEGWYWEVISYDRALTKDEIDQVEEYLNNKYSI